MRKFITIIILTIYSCTRPAIIPSSTTLDLSGRHLKTIPDSVFANRNLKYLDLGSKSIKFYPPLSALADSNANNISVLPEAIGNLNNLSTLILNSNNLTSLPNAITKLTRLEVLDLSVNRQLDLVHELDKLKSLPNLKVLKIVNVKLTKADLELVKSSLRKDVKVIVTISDYMESLQKLFSR